MKANQIKKFSCFFSAFVLTYTVSQQTHTTEAECQNAKFTLLGSDQRGERGWDIEGQASVQK